MSTQTTERPAATTANAAEHKHVTQARQALTELAAARITQMTENELFSWCSRLEVTARRLLFLVDAGAKTPPPVSPAPTGPTVRDALVELAELAIDNPELDEDFLTSVRTLTPHCASDAHRRFHWGELKVNVEQHDRGDLTAEGPEHWAARRDEALNELTGPQR